MTTTLAWVLALLTLPFVLVFWATESKGTRIQRLRRQGQTWTAIGKRYGVSPSTAKRWATT